MRALCVSVSLAVWVKGCSLSINLQHKIILACLRTCFWQLNAVCGRIVHLWDWQARHHYYYGEILSPEYQRHHLYWIYTESVLQMTMTIASILDFRLGKRYRVLRRLLLLQNKIGRRFLREETFDALSLRCLGQSACCGNLSEDMISDFSLDFRKLWKWSKKPPILIRYHQESKFKTHTHQEIIKFRYN